MLTVALCGTSLSLASIGASLQGRDGVRVIHVDPARAPLEQPDVVVFDLPAASRTSGSLSRDSVPQVLLIGLDLQTQHVIVFSGRHSRVATAEDLVQLIESEAGTQKEAAVDAAGH